MTIAETTAPQVRAGKDEVDLAVLAALREFLILKAEAAAARKKADAARDALDSMTTAEVANYRGAEVYRYRAGERRGIDLERLADRHPAAYADCLKVTPTSTLVVDDEHGRLLAQRNWRAAVRRR